MGSGGGGLAVSITLVSGGLVFGIREGALLSYPAWPATASRLSTEHSATGQTGSGAPTSLQQQQLARHYSPLPPTTVPSSINQSNTNTITFNQLF